MPPHFWCGADVEALGKGRIKYCLKDIQLKYIGSDAEFIDYCSEIAQFIWGVFVCLDQNFLSQDIQGIELETEDRPFRRIEAQGILIELRTFDTTYFCLYTDDLELAKKISDFYQITLECVSGVC